MAALRGGFDSNKRTIRQSTHVAAQALSRPCFDCRSGHMKYVPLMLCASITIWTAPSLAQTKQSPLMQPGATILTLNKMCQENAGTLPYTVCAAYLRGLFDGMQQAKMVEKTKDTFCPPATHDLDQLRLVIEKWVMDNPKDTKVSVGWAAPMAFSLAFPCN